MTARVVPAEVLDARRLGWADACVLLTVLIWGINPAVAKVSLRELHPLAFNAIRFSIATILELAIFRLQGQDLRMPWKDLRRIIPLAAVGVVGFQFTYIFGLSRTTAGNAAVLTATMPIFVALFAGRRTSRRLRGHVWLSTGLTLAGVAIITFGSGSAFSLTKDTLLGNGLVLLSAFCWATYTVQSGSLLECYSPAKLTIFSMLLSWPALVVIAIPYLRTTDWTGVSLAGWGGALYSGAFSLALSYLLWNTGIQRLGGTRVAVYSNLTPLVALAAAWLLLGEGLTWLQGAGVIVVLLGVWLTRFAQQGQSVIQKGEVCEP